MNSTIEEQQQTISHLRQELQNALDECKRLRKSPPLILPRKEGSNVSPVESAPWDAFEDTEVFWRSELLTSCQTLESSGQWSSIRSNSSQPRT